MLWNGTISYGIEPFETEAELEKVILTVQNPLFGNNRIYLDVKRKIGVKGKINNIPDGYLIDLTSHKKPVLYVVENELAKHDSIKHIAVQLLEFSISFETDPLKVKKILREAICAYPEGLQKIQSYIALNNFENLDYFLEKLVHEGGFNGLVIIDELDDELDKILRKRLTAPIEILTLQRYKSSLGDYLYQFDPFMADVISNTHLEVSSKNNSQLDSSDFDTVVVPAREEGFQETVIGEHCWHHIRIHSSMKDKIKYIAFYRTAPTSAITHIASVKDIQLWEDTSKYILYFSEPAKEINPIRLPVGSKGLAPQGPRYTAKTLIDSAKTLADIF